MSRKLATIRRIDAIRPIEGADKIEVAQIGGWAVVAKKDEFKEGDPCVYFEIDSFLPSSDPAFAFLAKDFRPWNGKEGVRLKTIKLRKQISQGLALPLSAFPVIGSAAVGDDVTDILKIEKWESPEEAKGNAGGSGSPNKARDFPWFIRKTDQERVQNRTSQLGYMLDDTFEKTIKLDGSSMTVYVMRSSSPHFDEELARRRAAADKKLPFVKRMIAKLKRAFTEDPTYIAGVCSRNMEVDLDGDSTFATYVRDHDVIEKILWLGRSVAFQGELIAPSIQGNFEKVEKPEWYVYDVYDINSQSYKLPAEARELTKKANLDYVPVLAEEFSLKTFVSGNPEETPRDLCESILADAEGGGMNLGVQREGVVYKSNTSETSFKAISQSYLLKKG